MGWCQPLLFSAWTHLQKSLVRWFCDRYQLFPTNSADKTLEELRGETAGTGGFHSQSPTYNVPLPLSVTYDDYENPWSLSSDASGSPHLRKMSPYSWVACGRDVYVLECLRSGYIKIEPMVSKAIGDPLYIAHHIPTSPSVSKSDKGKSRAYLQKRKILTADSVQAAIKGCDTYVSKKVMHGNAILG
jgi:ATP-dependent helicase IRC3